MFRISLWKPELPSVGNQPHPAPYGLAAQYIADLHAGVVLPFNLRKDPVTPTAVFEDCRQESGQRGVRRHAVEHNSSTIAGLDNFAVEDGRCQRDKAEDLRDVTSGTCVQYL
jgi:hypothetical protein